MDIKTRARKLVALVGAAAMVVGFASPLGLQNVQAAGVAVTVSAPANGEFATGATQEVTFGYTASATEFAAADAITVTVDPALPAALAGCATPTTDADGDATADGAFGSLTTTGAVYTFSAATTTAATGGVDLCLEFPSIATPGIYSITLSDDNDGDFGGALVYVGDDNDVTVTASVSPVLSMAIRDSGDTADTNECDLGALSVAAVNTCQYRIKVNTNAAAGYTVSILSDGDLSKAGAGLQPDADDIDPVTEDTLVTAGTEGYGAEFAAGAATTGTITEAGDFNDDDTPLPTTETNLYSSDGPNTPGATDTTNTALVTLRASIDTGTETGNYTQLLTHYTVANF
jgi:hypothetical protein